MPRVTFKQPPELMNESEAVWSRSRSVQTAAAVVDEFRRGTLPETVWLKTRSSWLDWLWPPRAANTAEQANC